MKEVVPTYVRIPVELKSQLDVAAKENSRSINGEIIARLQESFHPSGGSLKYHDTGNLLSELMRRYAPGELMIRIGKE